MSQPIVSILIPIFNAREYLVDTLQSVLEQSIQNFEVIMIDDGSTDNSQEIGESFVRMDSRFKLFINQKNLGICATLNLGLQHASGDFIARLDADDLMIQNRLELQINYLNQNPEIGIIGSAILLINQNGKIFGKRNYPQSDRMIREKIYYYSPFCHPAVTIRKELFTQHGGYDPSWQLAEDREFYFRVLPHTKLANLTIPLTKYRVRSESETSKKFKMMEKLADRLCWMYAKRYKKGFVIYLNLIIRKIISKVIPDRFKIQIFNLIRNQSK